MIDETTPGPAPDTGGVPCGEPCSVPGCNPRGRCARDWYTPHADHWCARCSGHPIAAAAAPVAHNGWTESEFGSIWWKAECSCGWYSDAVTSDDAAVALLRAHYETKGGSES